MSSTSWTQRFGISEKELSDLRNASPGGPLHAALVSGRVSEAEYFAWAMQTYELPRLKSDFFQIPPDPVFYEAVKRDFEWTPAFVPLAEWNGVLLIGCLEPPQFHFRVPFETRFVLASAKDLTARFEQLEPGKRVAVITPPPKAAPAIAVKPSVPPPQAPKVIVPPPPPPKPAAAPAKAVAPAPAPVTLPEPSAEEREALARLLSKPDIDLPEAPDISLDEPDGIGTITGQASDDRMVVPDGIAVGSVEIPKPEPVKPPVKDAPDGMSEKTFVTSARIDFSTISTSSPKIEAAAALPKDEVTNVPSAATVTGSQAATLAGAPAEEVTNPQAPKIAPFPPTVPKPLPQPADFTASAASSAGSSVVKNDVDILPLAQCTNYEDLAGSVLGRVLKAKYDVGMILLFQNGQLKPWKWTELMHSVKGENTDPIDLNPASIFRIVFRTCLPYHGYVVPNPVNTAYFNAFFRGVTPKHVTIMPVLINKKVAGMILGLANHEMDLRKSLGEMEIIAAEFGTHLDRVKSQKKAA